MSLQDLQIELDKINKIIPELEKYDEEGITIAVLPQDIKDNLKKITLLPPFTSAGLEQLHPIIQKLYLLQHLAEKNIKESQTNQSAVKPSQTTPATSVDNQQNIPINKPLAPTTTQSTSTTPTQSQSKPINQSWGNGPQPKSAINALDKQS